MKHLRVLITISAVVLVACAGLGFLIIGGMSGKEKVRRELPSPSRDFTAIQTYKSGFTDNDAYVYLKRGRFSRKQRLGSFSHILDVWWESSPERLLVKYTYVFAIKNDRVYIDTFAPDGSRLERKEIGRYVSSPDGSTHQIMPLEIKDGSQPSSEMLKSAVEQASIKYIRAPSKAWCVLRGESPR